MSLPAHRQNFSEVCVEVLRHTHVRLTHPRLAVIAVLETATHALTPKEILTEVKHQGPHSSIDLVSVYRTLELLARLKLVHQVVPSGGFLPCRHVSCGHSLHVMMHCRKCEETKEVDIPEALTQRLLNHLQMRFDFTVDRRMFQMDGLCEACRAS